VATALVFAAPAGAVVEGIGGGLRVSVQPLSSSPAGGVLEDPLDGTTQGVTYHGGPVVHGLTTYAVYWDPAGAFHASTESLISGFLAGSAHDSGGDQNIFSVAAQYTDSSGTAAYSQTYGGSFVDSDPYPSSGDCSEGTPAAPVCIYDGQEVSELESFVGAHHLPTGVGALYVILTPDSVVSCMDGTSQCSNNAFCSFHAYANDGSSPLLYIGIPFTLLNSASGAKSCQDDGNAALQAPNADPGFGDVALKALSHEELETISDPLLNAWYDADGNEIADLCNGVRWNADSFLPLEGGSASAGTLWNQTIDGAHYYLQGAWSNETGGCAMMSSFSPTFSVPPSSAVGAPITLSAAAGTTTAVKSYSWSFGDGQDAVGQSVTHSYAAPGSYTVTLTVTDAYGNTGLASERVVVGAPAGQTAGSSGRSKVLRRSKLRCGSLQHGRKGAEIRHCARILVSRRADRVCSRAGGSGVRSCHEVVRKVRRRQSCLERRPSGSTAWSRRCAAPRIVRRKR
jgi:hypothetical protein